MNSHKLVVEYQSNQSTTAKLAKSLSLSSQQGGFLETLMGYGSQATMPKTAWMTYAIWK